jgi:hypothetical protein
MNLTATTRSTGLTWLVVCTLGVRAALVSDLAYGEQLEQRNGKAVLRLEAPHIDGNTIMLRLSDLLEVGISIAGGPALEVQSIPRLISTPDWSERSRSEAKKMESGSGYRWQQSFELDPMKPGDFSLVLAPLRFRDRSTGNNWKEVRWAPIRVHVSTEVTNVDVRELRDIAPPEELPDEPKRSGALLLAIGIVGLVGLLIGAGEFARRRIRRDTAVHPGKWALSELRVLNGLPLDTPEEQRTFHLRLSDILRRYLQLRLHLPAPARTTTELVELLQSAEGLKEDERSRAVDILRGCDLVKFAGVGFPAQHGRSLVEDTCQLVEQMAQSETEPVAR